MVLRAFRPRVPRFGCSRSRQRVGGALELLGSAQVESSLAERGLVGAAREFGNRGYEFDGAEAGALFAEPPPAVVHR
jgi:molecular chaperone Hsp33